MLCSARYERALLDARVLATWLGQVAWALPRCPYMDELDDNPELPACWSLASCSIRPLRDLVRAARGVFVGTPLGPDGPLTPVRVDQVLAGDRLRAHTTAVVARSPGSAPFDAEGVPWIWFVDEEIEPGVWTVGPCSLAAPLDAGPFPFGHPGPGTVWLTGDEVVERLAPGAP